MAYRTTTFLRRSLPAIMFLFLMPADIAPADEAREKPAAGVVPVQFNVAEAVIEAFWSPEISGFQKWTVEPGKEYGFAIHQNWAAVDFEWASKPKKGPALRMWREFNTDCSDYDRLVVRLAPPAESVVHVIADTDKCIIEFVSPPVTENREEYAIDLEGAMLIKTITLEIDAGKEGNGAGWLRWIGLQSTERLPLYFQCWDYSRMQWDAHIKGEPCELDFKPTYGIFMTAEELEALRAEHAESVAQTGTSRFLEQAKQARDIVPERGIHEFAQSGGRTSSHSRVRDKDQPRLEGSPDLAVAGLVLKDAATLRMAARYALSEAMSEHWETGFMSSLPGCPWEDRAFRRSYASEDIAEVLDLAGEIFTETGRLYLMRRLAEEGIGPINFCTWRHEYIFHCNQLAYFNTGRMCAYLVLEREWPRVKPYTDLAYQDAVNNLEIVIEPDGGYLEGPSYFSPTVRENYYVLKHYARARGLDLASIVPEALKRTADFGAVVASTTENDVIPICDAGPTFGFSTLEVLTDLMPDSFWVTMYNKKARKEGKEPLPKEGPPLPSYVALPHTGHLASVRALDDELVKILVMGHKDGADHTHEDKGSFVLEFAGETFAMDLGICDYDNPIHYEYKSCQRHNMLVPVGMTERAHPVRPIPYDVKPEGSGDAAAFRATIDATPGWGGYYKKWIRTWDSPTPDVLTIRDEYELEKGDGVEFYWQTELPCEQKGQTVAIRGTRGTATLSVPDECSVRLEKLPLVDGDEHTRIAIGRRGTHGTLAINVRLATVVSSADPDGTQSVELPNTR